MTMTIKLAPDMEQRLRNRSAALGLPASALIREALSLYLASDLPSAASAYALGADVFGRHRGRADLAESRKRLASQAWEAKQAGRGG